MAARGVRRRKPAVERKEEMIPIRCTADQKRELTEKAKRIGLPLSAWLLSLGLSAPDKSAGKVQE